MLHRISVVLVLLVALALVTGCGSGVQRTADPSAGDFYTEEEYQKLSKDQREAYCVDLLGEYESAQDGAASARDDITKEQRASADLDAEMAKLTPRLKELKSEVDALNGQIAWFEGLPRVYVVQKGDFLYKISEMDEIYGDPLKWKRIYRANRELIEDPNLIYPDWELTVPRDWPHSYTVKIGENLWRIAGYWEIYGDATMWSRIYEANQAEISNPDVIQPGQILTIPR
ncbi:LysM peptidoglycan-binding domain-containing protein [bacterium]|jgi:nucleoid-associated protein YgaU|nr:LysM peptidoglycan-binding domain-containing protein [bacterium]